MIDLAMSSLVDQEKEKVSRDLMNHGIHKVRLSQLRERSQALLSPEV